MSLIETLPVRSGEIPSGLHNPVMLFQGLAEPGFFLTPATLFLRRQGMAATTSNIGVSTGRVARDLGKAAEHLHSVSEKFGGEKVALVGHSIGGLYAGILAARYPDMVKGVVTVGSPSHHDPIEAVRSFKLAGHHIMDLLHQLLSEYLDELREPTVSPTHHIITPLDSVVDPAVRCEDESHLYHRVFAPDHFSLMFNPLVLRMLKKILPSS